MGGRIGRVPEVTPLLAHFALRLSNLRGLMAIMRGRALQIAMLTVPLVLLATRGQADDRPDRTVLPVPEAAFKGELGTALNDSKPDFPKQIHAPAGAPNVLIIVLNPVRDSARRREWIVVSRAKWAVHYRARPFR